MNLYNDNDPNICAWVRQLIADGLIPPGDVSEKSITDLDPDYVRRFTQFHAFCGIVGWSYALQLAGVDPAERIWSGSAPCQPYSSAGSQLGDADPRNLWPAFFNLIRQCRPLRVVGEQVENAIGHGWLDNISADLESEGYACGAIVLGAHSVGAPHRRQRLYWVANAEHAQWRAERFDGGNGRDGAHQGRAETHGVVGACGEVRGVAEPKSQGRSRVEPKCETGEREWARLGSDCTDGIVDHAPSPRRDGAQSWAEGTARDEAWVRVSGESGPNGVALGDTDFPRPQGQQQRRNRAHERSPWAAGVAHHCTDGKQRLIEPSAFPLAHGVSGRVGLLRGYGNAIVPQTAAVFLQAAYPEICQVGRTEHGLNDISPWDEAAFA